MSPITPTTGQRDYSTAVACVTTHRVDYTHNPVDDGPPAHLRGYSPRIRRA